MMVAKLAELRVSFHLKKALVVAQAIRKPRATHQQQKTARSRLCIQFMGHEIYKQARRVLAVSEITVVEDRWDAPVPEWVC